MNISIPSTLITVMLALSCAFVQAQDCVSMYFDSNIDGDELVVQLKVDNFENILISQFAFTYSYKNVALIDIKGNVAIDLTSDHVFSEVPGYISVSWSNASTGQSLPNNSTLLEMRFSVIVSDITEFTIDPNYEIEIINGLFEEVCLQATPITINEERTQLIGKLYHDLNNNCIADPLDLPLSGWTVLIDAGIEKHYRVTDAFGNYNIPVGIGSYTIDVVKQSDLWTTCESPILVEVTGSENIIENSFVLSPTSTASALEIVVSSSEIRRCFDNVYSIKYKNNGTAIAQSATIEVLLDENLDFVSTSTGSFFFLGKTIVFSLGNIKPGEERDFEIVMNANCDKIEKGQTLCAQAKILSSDIDVPPNEWTGAVLTTQATCEEDSVAFIIKNIGLSAMNIPLQSIVVEDDVMFSTNIVDLDPQEIVKFKHAASGGVYRVLIDQEEGYPLGKFSTDFIEFCNGGSTDTYQYISMFQNEDESPYIDIECQEVRDDSNSNNMSAFPIGYREDHLINQNEDIEYTVYFQNLGTDTINNLYIETLIDLSLDLRTLIVGSSSHEYTMSIQEDRKIRLDFKNIQLPANETSDLRSGGFIKFRISQNTDVPIGTKINSISSIFFDLEDGIETNIVSHIVGEEFIEIILNNKEIFLDDDVMIAPNPAISLIKIELSEKYKNLSYVLYNTKGSVINAANTPSNVFYINRGFIKQGIYFLEIRSSAKVLGTKKIVFHD